MGLKVALTCDLKPGEDGLGKRSAETSLPDESAEYDTQETIAAITAALRKKGCRVKKVGATLRKRQGLCGALRELLSCLPTLEADIVFNIAEGYGGRNRESYVPIILELFDIPYVGSDSLTLSLALDKSATKKVLGFHGIPTPGNAGFPKIVKPRYEGSAKGIWPHSVVYDETELSFQVERTRRLYNQDVVVEQFIVGSECTVPILGNGKKARALAVIPRLVEKETTIACHVAQKANCNIEFQDVTGFCEALEEKIKSLALGAFFALDCRDFARVDFRISRDGKPYVLEVNPLPSLAKDDSFALVSEYLGWGYDEMIWRILECALERYGKQLTVNCKL